MKSQLFINKFQRGSKENANITGAPSYMVPDTGIGTLVGIDTYSKKGVARLARRATTATSNFTSYPTFVDFSQGGTYIWAQCADGSILYSADGGSTWTATDTSAMTSAGETASGNGMIFFQNFMIAFNDTKAWYWQDSGSPSPNTGNNPSAGAWVNWTSAKSLGTLQKFATDPINNLHFPFLFPGNKGVYFGNGGAGGTSGASTQTSSVGFFGQVGTTTFNPAGTINVDFLWNNGILQLPSYTWNVGSINFLPPANLAIAVNQWQNPSQGSDIITWDRFTPNGFTPPLRIYSNTDSNNSSTISAGIKQFYNRNNVLYAITGGNHSIYETNGSTFNLLEDIALYSNIRNYSDIPNGGELDYPVFFNSFPSAVTVVGNKLLTGVSPMVNTSSYPPANYGFFPVGVWSIAFDNQGGHSTQCEFIVPIGHDTISPQGSGNYLQITCLKPINTVSTSTGQILIGFAFKSAVTSATYGFAIVDLFKYVDDITYTAIESELFEIGTPLNPQSINNIEINFVKKLKTNQTFDLSYRTGLENDWTFIPYEGNNTVTGDNTRNYYPYTKNGIGPTQFVQLRIRMATDSGNAQNSPELKTVVIS